MASYSNLIKYVNTAPCTTVNNSHQKAKCIFFSLDILYSKICSWNITVKNKLVSTCVLDMTSCGRHHYRQILELLRSFFSFFLSFFLTAVHVVCAPERWTWTPRRGKRLDVIFSVLNGFSVSLKEPRILPRLSNGSASIYKACEIFFHVLILP